MDAEIGLRVDEEARRFTVDTRTTLLAVVNAVHHATGVRVRTLPVTLDEVLAGLPGV